MNLRSVVLGMAVGLAGAPACLAAELEFDVTAVVDNGPNTGQPLDISFVLNTLDTVGTPSYVFGTGGCMSQFNAGVSVSNFTASLGGQSLPGSAGSASFSGINLLGGGTCGGAFTGFISVGGYNWETGVFPNPSQTAWAAAADPLADLLLAGFTHGELGGHGSGPAFFAFSPTSVKITAIAVPEPGTLALMVLGVAGIAGTSFARRRGHPMRPAGA